MDRPFFIHFVAGLLLLGFFLVVALFATYPVLLGLICVLALLGMALSGLYQIAHAVAEKLVG
jgi:hypothetical protein